MRFRPVFVFLIGAIVSSCSLTPAEPTTPTSQTEPAAAATTQPAATEAATAAPATGSDATSAPAGTAAATTEQTTSGAFATGDCQFDVPEGLDVTCGFLTVPENRATGSDKTIRLAAAVFKSQSASPKPDPIVYLEGGPGGNAVANWGENFQSTFGQFNAERDFIIFDQRGTGYSEPSLACPEYTEEAYEQLDEQLTVAESTERVTAALLECRERLAGESIDLSAYNSIESAADMEALREALGYEQWNVYGISYGTRLALTAMREHPEGIRSVVLDSVVPLQESQAETPVEADRAFRMFFDGCAADEACNTAYPNLEETFYKLVDDLNANPVTEDVQDTDDGKTYQVLMTGDSMIGVLFFSLYITSVIPLMPRAIANAADGTDYSLLARLAYLSTAQNKDISLGMLYSVRCNEEAPFDTPEDLIAADDPFPRQRGLFDLASFVEVCNAWGAGKAPDVENQPVTSNIPTLVMSGQYDPVTPPANAEDAAKTLSQSFVFAFPGYGHGVSVDGECPVGITSAFFDDPTTQPDASCIDTLSGPEFAVPEGPITLTPFEDSDVGVSGVVPDSWEKVGPGAHAREAGDAVILQFAAQRSADEVLSLLQQQFSITETPEATGEHRSQRFTWTLYSAKVQGDPADFALAENDGITYVVFVASPAADRQTLYDSLFIPAIDALQPLQ